MRLCSNCESIYSEWCPNCLQFKFGLVTRRNELSKEMAKLDKKSDEFSLHRDELKNLSTTLKQIEPKD